DCYCTNKMADVNAPSGQTPGMAPPVRADDQILPHIRALLTIINWCLTRKTSRFERPRAPVLQILWGDVTRTNIDYAERIWEEFTNPYIHLVKTNEICLGIHQRRHRFHPRPDSPLHLHNEEHVLGYLNFSAKGTKREVFEMPILGSLITAEIQQASYYREYMAKVAQHRSTSQTTSKEAQACHKKSSKPPKAKKPKYGLVSKKRILKKVDASKAEDVHAMEPQVAVEDADLQRVLEESMKDAYVLPRGLLPPVVIREPESGKYQPLPKVPGKGKAKVTEEQVAHDLLSLQKHKKTSPADQYIFQRRVSEPTGSSEHDESPYALLGQSESDEESEKIMLGADEGGQDEGQAGLDPGAQAKDQTGSDAGAQDKGQAGSNPDETSEGQAGPDPGDAEAKVQSIQSPVVHVGSDREHIDLNVVDVSPQPFMEQLDQGFTATAYPKVQENLKLVVEEHVLLEEPASSSGTLSSLQHLRERLDSHGSRLYTLEQLDIPQQVCIAVSEVVTNAVDWAMQAPLRNRFRDLPEADMKEILHQRMWETESYKSHEDHMQLFEALEKSMNRDHSKELAQDLAEARKKNKKSHESPKMPLGSPSHQPPPPPSPVGPSGPLGALGTFGSSQVPPPPPSSTSHESPSKGSAAPSPSKSADTAEDQAWTTTDIRLRPSISLTSADLEIDEDMAPDEQAQLSDDEAIGSAHIPTVNLRQGWWKPFKQERPATLEPAWSIRSSYVPVPMNNWASALASNYSPPPKDSLLVQTDVTHLPYQIEECHKLLTDSVDDPILKHNVSKPLPLGGPPGQVTIQSDFFFNEDLEYLRYGSKGRRPALSISKMKVAYYPDVGLEQMVQD
nr:hypothetical protein [Tanacetum cinerariifolium]